MRGLLLAADVISHAIRKTRRRGLCWHAPQRGYRLSQRSEECLAQWAVAQVRANPMLQR